MIPNFTVSRMSERLEMSGYAMSAVRRCSIAVNSGLRKARKRLKTRTSFQLFLKSGTKTLLAMR